MRPAFIDSAHELLWSVGRVVIGDECGGFDRSGRRVAAGRVFFLRKREDLARVPVRRQRRELRKPALFGTKRRDLALRGSRPQGESLSLNNWALPQGLGRMPLAVG